MEPPAEVDSLVRHPRRAGARGVWRDALAGVWSRLVHDDLGLLAGGVAHFAVLSLMPALAVIVSLYSLASSPADIYQQVAPLGRVVPPEVVAVVAGQLEAAARAPGQALGLAVAISLGLSLFGTIGGIQALMTALNIAHKRPERRSFIRRTLIAFALGFGAVLAVIVAVALVVLLPIAMRLVRVEADTAAIVSLARWPALFVLVATGLAITYRVAPVDPTHRILAGTLVATVLWMAGSIALSLYVERIADYTGLYGAFGSVMIVLVWFYLSSFVILLGAVLNEELEEARWRRGIEGAPPRPTP
jgi:membrane protein